MKKTWIWIVGTCLSTGSVLAEAKELSYEITPYADVTLGLFHSQKSYNSSQPDAAKKTWQELSASYGVKGSISLENKQLYGSVLALTSATRGDGDAAQFTLGKESKTDIGEWTLGLKDTAEQQPFNRYDLSIGRQAVVIGDGFMVAGDALNMGRGVAEGELDRGGAYYLAARKSFDFTTVLKYRPIPALTTTLAYLKSNNKAQYQPELLVADAQYQQDKLGVGLSYLDVLTVKDPDLQTQRKNLKNYALRMDYLLNPALHLKAEYVLQDQTHRTENAGYVMLQQQFAQLKYQPTLSYRFSRFSTHYDTMFYGNPGELGTWFQGEVAGNYAGPFNKNANIHQVALTLTPHEKLTVGALAYKYDTINKQAENLDGYEFDLYGVWAAHKHINIIPLIAWYKPEQSMASAGSQQPDAQGNFYTQLLLQYHY